MPALLNNVKSGEVVSLGDHTVLGRGKDADIRLADQRVSREHAMIRRQGTRYFLYDLDSANGTELEGKSVSQPMRLEHDQVIRLGDQVFRFEDEGYGASATTALTDQTMIGFVREDLIFFVSDVVGYTALSERISETELADVMQPWYAHCKKVLQGNGAQIDKFIGDCVFAYWRVTDVEARASALTAAQQLVDYTAEKKLDDGTTVELSCAVGLHIGSAVVGAMARGDRTALGDAVNVAFRIESLTRALEAPILASAEFVAGWEPADEIFEDKGGHEVKGQSTPVQVFAPR